MLKNFNIIGGSGCGKTCFAKLLADKKNFFNKNFERIVQYTTRNMRDGEREGVEYYFISHEKYDKIKDTLTGRIINSFPPNKYGTPISEIKENNKNGLVNILVLGEEAVKDLLSNPDLKRPCENIFLFIIGTNSKNVSDNRGRDIEKENLRNEKLANELMNSGYFVKILNYDDFKEVRDLENPDFINQILEDQNKLFMKEEIWKRQ